jgi:hypothetical protein
MPLLYRSRGRILSPSPRIFVEKRTVTVYFIYMHIQTSNTYYLTALIVSLLVFRVQCATEIFRNTGMEDPDIEGVYGHAWGYTVERVSESHTGSFSLKLSGR